VGKETDFGSVRPMQRTTTRRLLAGYALTTVLVVGLTAGEASALSGPAGRTRAMPTTTDQVPASNVNPPAARRPVAKPRPAKRTVVRRPAARRPAPLPTTLQVAQSQVGGAEARYTTEWSFSSGFWCAKFVSWVLAHAGVPIRADGPKDLTRLVAPVTTPRPGDLVFIDLFPGREGAGITHVGIVEAVEPDGSVRTIEGNTSGSETVARAVRRGAEIAGFGRPPAPTSSTVIPAPPPTEADCEWVELGKPWMCDW
jgi:hypothetical protein